MALAKQAYQKYFNQAISWEQYLENFEKEMALGDQSAFAEYLPQNWSRQARLYRKLKLRPELVEKLEQIKQPIKWLVITEHWCGDASQINPVIAKAAEQSNGKIDLKFIYRDVDTDLIDAHLTDGRSRSIPILLVLDQEYNFISSYGPRPEEAQKLVKSLLAKDEAYNIPLHTWYAKDKQQGIQDDLMTLLSE